MIRQWQMNAIIKSKMRALPATRVTVHRISNCGMRRINFYDCISRLRRLDCGCGYHFQQQKRK